MAKIDKTYKVRYLENKFISMFKTLIAGDIQSVACELYPEDFNIE